MRPLFRRLLPLSLLALAPLAHSQQTQNSGTAVLLGNDSPGLHQADFYDGTQAFDYHQDYSTSGGGFPQTMSLDTLSASAAEFNRLHSAIQGSLANTYSDGQDYYDEDGNVNPDAVPGQLLVNAFSLYTDTLQYGGVAGSGYTARYLIHVDGNLTGDLDSEGRPEYFNLKGTGVSAQVNFQVDNAANGGSQTFFAVPDRYGHVDTTFATHSFPVASDPTGDLKQKIFVELDANFFVRPSLFDNGTNLGGTSDFSSTAYVSSILLYDPNGVLVSNYTINGAGGQSYPGAVPEPASLAALGLGALTFVRRRRR